MGMVEVQGNGGGQHSHKRKSEHMEITCRMCSYAGRKVVEISLPKGTESCLCQVFASAKTDISSDQKKQFGQLLV